jgi:biopolymer transport protein ExbD
MNFYGFFMNAGADEIDLAPLVDIAFLLLTFFMMTTVFAPQEKLKVETPESSSDKQEPTKRYITVIVGDSTKGNKMMVNMEDYNVRVAALSADFGQAAAVSTEGVEVTIEKLKEVLLKARLADANQVVVLRADKNVKFNVINKVMLAMREVKFDKVQMTTKLEK